MAGEKFNAAEPEVQQITTGTLVCCAIPKAKNAAHRSSTTEWQMKLGCLLKESIRGAFLDPGLITTCFTPF